MNKNGRLTFDVFKYKSVVFFQVAGNFWFYRSKLLQFYNNSSFNAWVLLKSFVTWYLSLYWWLWPLSCVYAVLVFSLHVLCLWKTEEYTNNTNTIILLNTVRNPTWGVLLTTCFQFSVFATLICLVNVSLDTRRWKKKSKEWQECHCCPTVTITPS